jgi:predicted MFS family arabinose efflux permease
MADEAPWRALTPLVLATMASQALLVVLAPTIVAIGRELDASVATVGQARSVTAAVSITVSVAFSARADALGVRRLIRLGAVLGILACAAVAAAGSTVLFLAAHALVGLAFALLLSAGFAGVAAFAPERRVWATGFVAGANALAWIVVNPLAANLTEWSSWRWAQAVPALVALAALLTAGNAAPTPARRPGGSLWAPFTVAAARRWVIAEMVAFGAWTAVLTFAGAFFIQHLGVREAVVGWLLAAGAAAYFVASTRTGWLVRRVPLRLLVAWSSLAMAVVVPVMLGVTDTVVGAVVMFCLIGVVAGVRTPASAGLGLQQLPEQPGAMMAARTAATQLGYLIGAVVGGAVIAGPGYGVLGLVLGVGMVLSAWLALRVRETVRTQPAAS